MLDLETLLKLIEQYGLSLLLLVLGIVFFAPIVKNIADAFTKFLSGIFQFVIDLLRGKAKENPSVTHRGKIEETLRFDMEVNALLRETMISMESDWATLWQFHNGIHGLGSMRLPFIFLALTHEQKKYDVEQLRFHFEKLPTAMFDRFAGMILENEIVVYEAPADGQDHTWGQFGVGLKNLGVKSGYIVPMRDSNGDLIGLFSVAFRDVVELDADSTLRLKKFAARVSLIMATYATELVQTKGIK